MPPKKSIDAFTSFRIIGKRAQELLLKATQELKKRDAAAPATEWKTDDATQPKTFVQFLLGNILQILLIGALFACGIWLVIILREKIILLLLGFFVAAIIDPGVRMMERWGMPRGLGILAHYIVGLVIFVLLLISLIPIIASQLQQISVLISNTVNDFLAHPQILIPLVSDDVNLSLTTLLQNTLQGLSIMRFTDALSSLGTSMQSIFQGSAIVAGKVGLSLISFFVQLAIVLVLAFFIQIERESIHRWLRSFFASKQRAYIDGKIHAIREKIGQWARGQLLLGLTIGILVYIALKILRMPNAETLAVLAGFTEFIPYIGPFIAAIPAVLIAVTQEGPVWALIVVGVYYVIQWCENNMLVPLIMKRAVGLSPIAIIFAMLTGLSFPDIVNPVLGLLLAVPVTTILSIFLNDWRRQVPEGQ